MGNIFNHSIWSRKHNYVCSVNGKSILERVLGTLQRMEKIHYIFLREPETLVLENLKHKDLDGLQHGEDYIKKLNKPILENLKRRKNSRKKELLKELPLKQLKN